ncbi:MAG TPA: carboxypeptidase-like regulatory domain-containing protein, partial [Planctomycetota bacterium]
MVEPCTLLLLLAVTFQAPNQALVRGRLEDPLGRPAEGAEVTSRVWPGVDKVAVCDAEGRFEMRVEWPEHQRDTYHECKALAPGCAFWSTSAKLRPGEELDLGTVRLEPGGSVRGTLRLGSAPAGVASVLVVRSEALPAEPGRRFEVCPATGPAFRSTHAPEPVYEQPVRRGASLDDGSFRILGLPPGRYGLWARSKASYWATSAAFEVRVATETELPELVLEALPPQHRIAGVVLDPDGLPVAGASVEARTPESDPDCFRREVESDASGRFELHVLPLACGPMELRAKVPDDRFSGVRVGPVAPGTVGVELHLGRMQELRVRVVGRDGLPVERYGWRLELEDDSGLVASGSRPEERPEGRATLRFPTGSLRRLSIEAPGYREQHVDLKKGADELLVSLRDALPAIAGFVTAGGAPVAGAHV